VETGLGAAAELDQVLSEPIGLGLILSYIQEGHLYGLDVIIAGLSRLISRRRNQLQEVSGRQMGKKMVISRDGA